MIRTKAPTGGPVRYALYSRCSSDDQAHKDFSTIDVQDALNRQHISERGGVVAEAYRDEGISGTTLKRPGWKKMIADAQAGRFDTVVCTYMSRLGRGDTCTVAEYLLKEAGVRVEMVKETFTDDMAGYVNKTMTRFVDGMYVQQVRQWTMTKMEAMVKEGYHCGGFPPFGYARVTAEDAGGFHKAGKEPPKRLVPHPEEGEQARQAFHLYADQGSLAAVREYLDAVTPRRWTTSSVKGLLTNEVFRGVQQFGQWRNEAAHPALVDGETWNLVQARLEAKAGRYARRNEDGYTYYLRGCVVCPHCGCGYTQACHHGRGGRVAHYYVCQKANRREKCPVGRVNADRLHVTVLHYLRHASTHRTVMHRLIAESGGWGSADDAQRALRGQLAKKKQFLDMKAENYLKAIGEGRALDALLPALEKVEAERRAVLLDLAQAEESVRQATVARPTAAQVSEAWGRIVDVWAVLDEGERTTLLGSVVQRVEVTEKESVALELLPMPMPHSTLYSDGFALTDALGAGVARSAKLAAPFFPALRDEQTPLLSRRAWAAF